ncbi:MAG TPA: TonB-dependent receptor [Burkholderiaceae bacterium]
MTAPRTGALLRTSVPLPFVLRRGARALLATLPALAAGSACAQSSAGDVPAQDVVVTAARTAQKLPDTLPATTVISRHDIEASPATDLPDLLRQMTSFGVAQTGPLGSQTSVFLRGANSNQVLVLVDGAPLSRADFGSAPWELIPLGQIDHVEIVRGNLSSLYGASAVGGVVQIFTRKGAGASVSVGVGGNGHVETSGSIGRRLGDAATPLELSASLSGQNTDGYSARDPKADPTANPDRDPGYQAGATVSIGKTWAPGQRTDFSVMHSYTHSDYDGYTKHVGQDTLTTDLDEFSLRSRHQLATGLAMNLSAGQTLEHFRDPTEADGEFGASPTVGSGRTRLLGAELDWQAAPDHQVQLQFEDRDERFGEYPNAQQSRRTKSERLGYLGRVAGVVEVQANLRHDDADDFGSADTGLLALGWNVTQALKLVGQFSTAFSAPSFTELEYAVSPDALKAERSRDLEFGAHWQGRGWLARATWFSQHQRDLVGFNAAFQSVNIGRATNRGVELAADGDTGLGKVGLDATFQNPRDGDTDTQLLRRPRTVVAASWRVPLMGWESGVYVRYAGRHLDADPVTFADVEAKARTTLGLSTQHALSPNWTLGAKVDNVANTRTPEVLGYTAPRRELLFTLRGTWQ